MAGWRTHKAAWSNCQSCPLCADRYQVVLYRGQIPCDILIVGEAPGESEDMLGTPFIGAAGQELDAILSVVYDSLPKKVRVGITNTVACVPWNQEDEGSKTRAPTREEMEACDDRLEEIVELAEPRFLVAAGRVAERHLVRRGTPPDLHILHPSAILRKTSSRARIIARKKTILALIELARRLA